MLVASAAVTVLVAVFAVSRQGGPAPGSQEIFLQAAAAEGRDPFTPSTAEGKATPSDTPTTAATAPSPSVRGTRSIQGSAPGLYGGTRSAASCDVERQITYLTEDKDKGRAWAGVAGIAQSDIPSYLRSLTPAVLRADTRVTNHGYADGAATSYQAVLQAGTAVLVDSRGVPRVRCACGNPLLPPRAVPDASKQTGRAWPSYQPSQVIAVEPAPEPMEEILLVDPADGSWFSREAGSTGGEDRSAPRPSRTEPPESPPESPACPTPGADGSCPAPDGSPTTTEEKSPASPSPSRPPSPSPASPSSTPPLSPLSSPSPPPQSPQSPEPSQSPPPTGRSAPPPTGEDPPASSPSPGGTVP